MEQEGVFGSSFGQWVKLRRNVLRLTQDELARLVLCSNEMIRKIESDARRPSLETAERLAEHLAISSDVRPIFIKAARGERSAIHLPSPTMESPGLTPIYLPAAAPAPPIVPTIVPVGDPSRQRLLNKVNTFWLDGVLEPSLYNHVLLPLTLIKNSSAVADPWAQVLHRPRQMPQLLPANRSILDIFDESDGQLLILGAPGAGKTTLLLTLAAALLARARQEGEYPMPVVFTLSSWGERAGTLTEWLADELEKRYDSPRPMANSWIEQEAILLLLDGLDEVAEEKRAACVDAINAFRQEHRLVKLAICSRLAAYEALGTKLQLGGAICIQPLTQQQVDSYLMHAGPQVEAIRELLAQDESLRKILHSPLVLNLLLVSHGALEPETTQIPLTAIAWRARLLTAYVDYMFARQGAAVRYSRAQTTRWLTWLANALATYELTIFHVEELQPSWLATAPQRRLYVGAVSLIIGLLIGLSWALPWVLLTDNLWEAPGGLWIGLVRGTVNGLAAAGLVSWVITRHHAPPVVIVHGWTIAWPTLGMATLLGGIAGLVGAVVLAPTLGWAAGLALSESAGLTIGIASGVAFGLLPKPAQITPVETMRWSWSTAIREPLAKGAFAGVAGVSIGTMLGLATSVVWGGSLGLVYGFASGGAGSVAIASILMLIDGLRLGELETKVKPNQGIARSAGNALRIMLGVGLGSGAVVGLIYALIFGVADTTYAIHNGLWIGLAAGAAHGVGIGLFSGLIYGGFAYTQHWVLRTILWATGAIPWNYPQFLDFAADRIFLHKVGGGYIFMHRLLQEYFGTLTSTEEEETTDR